MEGGDGGKERKGRKSKKVDETNPISTPTIAA
jgi:hypothetical protein